MYCPSPQERVLTEYRLQQYRHKLGQTTIPTLRRSHGLFPSSLLLLPAFSMHADRLQTPQSSKLDLRSSEYYGVRLQGFRRCIMLRSLRYFPSWFYGSRGHAMYIHYRLMRRVRSVLEINRTEWVTWVEFWDSAECFYCSGKSMAWVSAWRVEIEESGWDLQSKFFEDLGVEFSRP